MKNLSTEHPIDKHLKPVKDSDGNNSSLEISTEKVRVKDLEVTGTTTGIETGTSITVDSSLTDGSTNPVENNAVFDGLATKLNLSGGTMTGDITFPNDGKVFFGDSGYYIRGSSGQLDIITTGFLNFGGARVVGAGRFTFDDGSATVDTIKDEDDMASDDNQALATQQSIKAYVDNTIRDIKSSGFNYSYTAGTKVYIPLGSSTTESTSLVNVNEFRNFVVPFDGYLDQVVFRSEQACGSTVVGLHKSSAGTEIPNSTASTTVTVDMTSSNTAYKFDFTSSNTFSAGDIIAISFDPTNDANDTNATVVLVYDGSQGV